MKKIVLRSLTISALSLVGGSALADEATAPQSQNTVTPYGIIQVNENFYDSEGGTPSFQASRIRPGVVIKNGIVSGQIELQYNGNQKPNDTSGNTLTSTSTNNTVTLRQAQLNLDVVNAKMDDLSFKTTVSLGGVRVNGANATAPDAAYTPTGYGRQDGVYLAENVKWGRDLDVQAGFGVFNNLTAARANQVSNAALAATSPFPGWGLVNTTLQPNWGSQGFTNNIAYLADVNATYSIDAERSINGIFYYGSQKNDALAEDANGHLLFSADATHIEASLTYNDTGIFGNKGVISGNGVTAWFEQDTAGKTQQANYIGGGYTYANAFGYDDSQTATLLGVGASADSEHYLSNMLQKGDRLTYALSYTNFAATFGSATASQNYYIDTVAGSVGYAVGTFETAVNVSYDNSNQNAFLDANGGSAHNDLVANEKTHTKVYLTAFYAF